MRTKLNQTILAGILLLGAFPLGAQQSWGDKQPDGVRESATTGLFSPGRQVFDGSVNTAWQLAPGATSGWVERYWPAPLRLGGADVNLDLPQGSQLQLSSLVHGGWVPIPGAVVTGPVSGRVSLTFPGELPLTTRVLVSLQGSTADQARLWDLTWKSGVTPQPYGKILPKSSTFNQGEYINLKASRLWDGIAGNSWFSPLWSVPPEVFLTADANKPTGIFPPYLGNPPQDGEIVWELDGSYTIQTLKTNFLQNYRSLKFDFWDGSKWTNAQVFGAGSSDPGQGWKRLDLSTAVTTNRIRITFPGGWERARDIGEVEVWGQGWNDAQPLSLVIGAPDASGAYHFTVNSTDTKDHQLEVTVAGSTAAALSGEWNGTAFSVGPATWVGEDTVYRIPVAQESQRSDVQFLKLTPSAAVHSVVYRGAPDRGTLDLGWPYGDGQFAATTPGAGKPVPSVKHEKWALGNSYQLEKLRVYSTVNPGTFKTWSGTKATTVAWTGQGTGWWEASLGGISADHLSFDSTTAVTLDEVQLWGTPLADTQVGMEVWWGTTTVAASVLDSNSVIGWMGDASVQPLVGGFHPRQADKLFWMPLNQMGLAPGRQATWTVEGTLGSAHSQTTLTATWRGTKPAAVLDQGTALLSTTQGTVTLSGTVDDSQARVFVNGTETAVAAKKFTTAVTLKTGFQQLTVEVWDKPKTHLELALVKPVYRTTGQPLIVFDQPPGDFWSQNSTLPLTGRVGNGVGLTLTLNGSALAIQGNQFSTTAAFGEGTQDLKFVLKDSAGRQTDQKLTVLRDSTAPVIQVQTPAVNQYIAYPQVTFQVSGGADAQLWWRFNTEPWEPGLAPVKTKTYTLADGFYSYQVQAQDRAGNLGNVVTVPFCIDTTPPVHFGVTANVSGWTSNNTPTITFGTADATAGVDHYEYLVDTGDFVPAVSPFRLPILADGIRTVYVKAVDKAGNTTIEHLDLFIDTSLPPTPTAVLPIPGADNVTLRWTGVNDGEGFQTYRVERIPAWSDGVHTVAVQDYGSQSMIDPGLASGSVYQYRLWAVDRAGNASPQTEWVSIQVGLANVAVNPTGPTVVNFNQVVVTMPAGVAASDVTALVINELPVQVLTDQPTNPLVSPIFQFRAARTDSEGSTITDHADFLGDLTVQINYNPAKIPDGFTNGDLKAFYYDSLWGRWLPIAGSVVDPNSHQVLFKTNHFSDFSVQATKEADLSPQQLRDVQFSPLATNLTHAPVTISAQGGTASTAFTELVLPGKNGLDLVVKRIYDSGKAQSDGADAASEKAKSKTHWGFPGGAPNPVEVGKDGGSPWYMGPGWRLNFPFLKWNYGGLWVTGLDGTSFSFSQASLKATSGSDGQVKTVTMENHEGSDSAVTVTFRPTAHYTTEYFLFIPIGTKLSYTYAYDGAQLSMKDGRVVDFDALGRVQTIHDSARLNVIFFEYASDNQASRITDSMGRKIVFSYSGKMVDTMNVVAGGETYQSSVRYHYDGQGNLTSAVDVGARTWTYGYTPMNLTTSTHITAVSGQTSPPPLGYEDPQPTNTPVSLLSSASGPGLGFNTISYQLIPSSYDDGQNGVSFTIYQQRIMAFNLTVGSNANTAVRNFHYEYITKQGSDHQLFVLTSAVTDGRTKTTTEYGTATMARWNLSDAPEALKGGLFEPPYSSSQSTGRRPDVNEVVNYPTTIILTPQYETTPLETRAQTWDWTNTDPTTRHGRMLGETLTYGTGSASSTKTDYLYDTWGNTSRIATTATVSDRTTSVAEDFTYYNTGMVAVKLGLGKEGVALTEPKLNESISPRNLMAAHRRVSTGTIPGAPDQSLEEFTTYQYSSLGQLNTKKQFVDGQWATTDYDYDDTSGELRQVDGPMGLTTTYVYDYTSHPTSYGITTTQKDIDLGASVVLPVVTVNTYKLLNGTNTETLDAKQRKTSRTFDNLGRVKTVKEPAVAAGVPTTTVIYDDVNLSSTVENPLGLTTVYAFDPLGRLTSVKKTDKNTLETIETRLAYDAWDDVVTLKGPVSSLEETLHTGRTWDNVVTTFGYDLKGRVTSVQAPGAGNAKRSYYDDANHSVTTYDEVGNQSVQILDWNGKPITQTVVTGGNHSEDLTSLTYYDGLGRVLAEIDPNLNKTLHQFNALGLETKTIAPPRTLNGVEVSPETNRIYDLAGRLTEVRQPIDSRTRTTTYHLNALGQVLSSATNVTVAGAPQTIVVTSAYDALGNKVGESSGYAGQTSTGKSWTYDSHGRVLTETDEDGKTVTYTYDLAGNRTGVTDPRQGLYPGTFQLTLTYNQLSRLVKADLPSLTGPTPTIAFTYDGKGNLVKRQEPDGQVTNYTYSLRSQLVTETVTDGTKNLTTTHDYDDAGRETKVTAPSGHAVLKTYDGASRIVEVDQNTNTVVWNQFTYYPNGNRRTVTDGNQHTTTYTYNPEGQVLTTVDAAQQTSTTTYDLWGHPVLTVDAGGNQRTYTYDELGRLTGETAPWGATLSTTYDAWGGAVSQTDASGTVFARTFSATKHLLTETAARSGKTLTRTFTYDEGGDLKTATDNGILSTYNVVNGTYQPDPYGLIRTKADVVAGQTLAMAYSYDNRQRLTGVSYPGNTSVGYTYNQLGQVDTMPGWVKDGTLAYDTAGRLTGYTLTNGVAKAFDYDDQDRLKSLTYATSTADLKAYGLHYDQAGNIDSKLIDGKANAYSYDSLNRLTGAVEHGWFQKQPDYVQKIASYGYVDRDYSTTDDTTQTGTEVLTFEVDSVPIASNDTLKLDTSSRSVGVNLGAIYGTNQIAITPASKNPNHRVNEADLSVYVSPNNNPGSWTKVEGWVFTKSPDDGTITLKFPKIVQAWYIKVNTIWDDRDGDNQSIDSFAQVANVAKDLVKVWALKDTRVETESYDPNGNRLTQFVDEIQTQDAKYYLTTDGKNLPWLASNGVWFYQYDLNGNLVTKAKKAAVDYSTRAFNVDTGQEYWTYDWDLKNRLVGVSKNGALVVSYAYNAENLRVSRVKAGAETTVYTYGRNGAIAYQKNLATTVARTYAYLGDQTVGWTDTASNGAKTQMFSTVDYLGSVTQVTNANATVVWSSEYDPFGKTSGVEGLYDFDGSYAGHQVDKDTELIYMWNRWQDPETGRFISEDPARDGNNWYAYAGNNPINSLDPTGLIQYVLNSPNQVKVGGITVDDHQAILIDDPNNKGQRFFFTKDGTNDTNAMIVVRSGQSLTDAIGDYNSAKVVENKLKGSEDPNAGILSNKYANAIKVGTSPEQDARSILALGDPNSPAYYRKDYSLVGKNCGDLVADSIKASGILDGIIGNSFLQDMFLHPTWGSTPITSPSKQYGNLLTDAWSYLGGLFKQTDTDTLKNTPRNDPTPAPVAPPTPVPATSTGSGSSGSGSSGSAKGGSIICTELHRQGLMDDRTYQADEKFGARLESFAPVVLVGYRFIATPIVAKMRESKDFTSLVAVFGKPWAEEMSYQMGVRDHGNFGGLVIMVLGIPLAGIVGVLLWALPAIGLALVLVFFYYFWQRFLAKRERAGVALGLAVSALFIFQGCATIVGISMDELTKNRDYLRVSYSAGEKQVLITSNSPTKQRVLSVSLPGAAYPVFVDSNTVCTLQGNRLYYFHVVPSDDKPAVLEVGDVHRYLIVSGHIVYEDLNKQIYDIDPSTGTSKFVVDLRGLNASNISNPNASGVPGTLNDIVVVPELGRFIYTNQANTIVAGDYGTKNYSPVESINGGFRLVSHSTEGTSILLQKAKVVFRYSLVDKKNQEIVEAPGEIVSITPIGEGVYCFDIDLGRRRFPDVVLTDQLLFLDRAVFKQAGLPWRIYDDTATIFVAK